MRKQISAKLAKERHGVSTLHEQMDNGEVRFRLKHSGGSAYIRTKASDRSGWQNSHYHAKVRESYIVESGWMALAELTIGEARIRVFEAGDLVTTSPGVVHNVYLSDTAVIHTVKHGASAREDRFDDGDCQAFDLATRKFKSDAEVRAAAMAVRKTATYSEGYRHFDTLIWQVPAWSTAIFAISCQLLLDRFGTPEKHALLTDWAGYLLGFLSLSLFVFAQVLYRFRSHQRSMKGFSNTPLWKSASTWTQSLIVFQSAVLLGACFIAFRMMPYLAVSIALIAALTTICVFEQSVRNARVDPQ